MRILLVNGFAQGSRTYTENLAKALVARGHEVAWLHDPFPFDNKMALPRLALLELARTKFEYWDWSYTPIRALRTKYSLKKLTKEFEPDLVHATDPTGALIWPKRNLPVVATIHHPATIDLQAELAERRFRVLDGRRMAAHALALCEKLQARTSTQIITVSEFSRKELARWYSVNPSRVFVVYNGLDAEPYRHASASADRPTRDGAVRVLHVGRNSPRKRIPFLLQAFAIAQERYPSLRLRLVGCGSLPMDALSESEGIADSISFVPFASSGQLIKEYAAADVFATASLAEGFSYVVVEAMAAGLPVIAPQSSVFPEIVRHGHEGFLFATGSTQSMAEQMVLLAQDPALRREMGRRGREKVAKQFDVSAWGARMEGIYREVLSLAP